MTAGRVPTGTKEVATELSQFHKLIAEERKAPEDEIRRMVHRLLFLRALELIEVQGEGMPVFDELVGYLDRPAIRHVLARLRAPEGPWRAGPLTAAGFGAVHELYLATGYEHGCETIPAKRKRFGAYYTPDALVEHLVDRALDLLIGRPVAMPRGELGDWTILDPACGGGRFLVKALGWLLEWYRSAWNASDLTEAECLSIARRHLYGLDLDPLAVDITHFALALALSGGTHGMAVDPGELKQNVVLGDALRLGPIDQERQLTLNTEEASPQMSPAPSLSAEQALHSPLARGGFDLVIGNPPYVSFSGRHAESPPDFIPRSEVAVGATRRWPSLHGYFVEHAIERLSRRLVAFVLPDQVGHLDSYKPVRETITRHAGLVDVRYWGEDVFPGVVSPILTFMADRRYSGRTSIESRDGDQTRRQIMGGARWHVLKCERLLARLLEEGESLGRLVGDPGVHTGNCAAKLIIPPNEVPPGAVPVLEGRLVGRYSCEPPTKYLRLDYEPGEGEYFRIGREDRYAAAAFLIRQTAGFPIVGPRAGALYFRNSLLALYEPENADVRFLVGLLNSSLMRALYRLIVPESGQRTFPQVKVSSLRMLPIRWPGRGSETDWRRHDEIVALVDRLLEIGASRAAPVEAERAACEGELDALVFDFYGVIDAERRTLLGYDPLPVSAGGRVAA